MTEKLGWMSRRDLAKLLGVGGAAIAAGLPERVYAQAKKTTLVIGIDISDTITLDPARQAQYTPPMSLLAAYDMLVTMSPGDYINIKPSLATKWARTPDGKGWRFTLRDGVKFASGNPMTAEDVKWSMDRVLYLGDQTSQYISHVQGTAIVDAKTVDIILKDPTQPLLTIIAAPGFRADPARYGVRSETVIACDFTNRVVLIVGTSYAGEMKKAVFTSKPWIVRRAVLNDRKPPSRGIARFTRKWSLSIPCCRCLVT